MKYCEEYAALLDLFVDGELTGVEMKRVRDHLEKCPGCRAYVDDALAIRAGFLDVEETAVPEGFAEAIMERIREDTVRDKKIIKLKRREVRRWLSTAAALAACCALVVILRTGPGNLNGGAAVVTSGAGAPADSAAIEGAEMEIAPQTESGEARSAQDLKEAAPEETENRAMKRAAVADSCFDTVYTSGGAPAASPQAPAEAALESTAPDESAFTAELCLTAEEVGGLLDGEVPVWEGEAERRYELTAEVDGALLTALGRPEELPEEAEGRFLVVVTGP